MNTLFECRICNEEDIIDNLIYPCKCTGTQKYVHNKCLITWMQLSTNTNSKIKCDVCKHVYQWSYTDNNYFYKLMIKDFLLYTSLSILSCIFLGYLSLYIFNHCKKDKNDSANEYCTLYNCFHNGLWIIISTAGIIAWGIIIVQLNNPGHIEIRRHNPIREFNIGLGIPGIILLIIIIHSFYKKKNDENMLKSRINSRLLNYYNE